MSESILRILLNPKPKSKKLAKVVQKKIYWGLVHQVMSSNHKTSRNFSLLKIRPQ